MISIVILTLLINLNSIHSYQILSSVSCKVRYPVASFAPNILDSKCYTAMDTSKTAMKDKKRGCQVQCFQAGKTLCNVYSYIAPKCIFLSYLQLSPQIGDSGMEYYSDSCDSPIDIARYKTATGSNYFVPFFGPFYASSQSVTNGIVCFSTQSNCWCSGGLYPGITIDLGISHTVLTVIITPIPGQETDLGNGTTDVYVGNSGSWNDPKFGVVWQSAPGTKVMINGNLSGKYIYLFRNGVNLLGLCFCFLEAYGY